MGLEHLLDAIAEDWSRPARFVALIWSLATVILFGMCWGNVPVLALFFHQRWVQVHDLRWRLRPTTPIHDGMHFFCATFFGVLLPGFFYLTAGTNHRFFFWYPGAVTNHPLALALGWLCLAWMLTHLLEALLRGGVLKFGPGGLDRAFAMLALAVGVWFFLNVFIATFHRSQIAYLSYVMGAPRRWDDILAHILFRAFFISCFAGILIVYGFACWESWKARSAPGSRRRWKLAAAPGVLLLAVFGAWWLTGLPKVSRERTLVLLEEQRQEILETAKIGELDPGLLAGIIYVSHTEHCPRWRGRQIESFTVALFIAGHRSGVFPQRMGTVLGDAPVGLCQIRPTMLQDVERAYQFGPVNLRRSLELGRWSIQGARRRPSYSSAISNLFQRLPGLSEYSSSNRNLLPPERNLALAALALKLMALEWEQANRPIDGDPARLATFFRWGFERSAPRDEAVPDEFGWRVFEFMESTECRKLFPKPTRRER